MELQGSHAEEWNRDSTKLIQLVNSKNSSSYWSWNEKSEKGTTNLDYDAIIFYSIEVEHKWWYSSF